MRNNEVRAEIEKGQAALEQAAVRRAEKHGITKEWWLKELHAIANADMDAFLEVEDFLKYRGKSGKEYRGQRLKALATKLRKAGLGKLIKKLSETKNGIGIELHSKQAAFELIGKHFGWAKEHVHHSGGTQDSLSFVDPDALAEALKKIKDQF